MDLTFSTLCLPSQPENAELALSFLMDCANAWNWSEDLADRILQAGSEAFINGMKHGNGYNPQKTVLMQVKNQPNGVEISVQDEGKGFDPAALPDPLADHLRMATGGRGVFLMRHWANEVRFEDAGRRVILWFTT